MLELLILVNKFLSLFRLRLSLSTTDYSRHLHQKIDFSVDKRAIRDDRTSSTYLGRHRGAASVTIEALEDVTKDIDLRNKKILEIGPKFGFHTLWIDDNLAPSKIVLSELELRSDLYEEWKPRVKAPVQMYWGDILSSDLARNEKNFDVIFNLGVIYHCVEIPKLLVVLNKVARDNSIMFIQTTIDPFPGANIRLGYREEIGGHSYPSEDALLIMLAQSGWKKITKFENYRKNKPFLLLKCEKTSAPEDFLPGFEYAGSSVVL